MTVFQFIEDFDNAELNEYDRREQLIDAVIEFNAEYGASEKPELTVDRYERWKLRGNCDT